MLHRVIVEGAGTRYDCGEDESLLAALHRQDRRGIPMGCRGGGCGVCRVRVLEGRYATLVMSRAHVTTADEAEGRVLACRVFPRSELRITPDTSSLSSFLDGRK